MYKLVAVGGRLRGEEYVLQEGDNILGRDAGCDIHTEIDGVSKKHLLLSVKGDSLFLRDMDSSNGTLVNGKNLTTSQAKSGDKIAIPDVIFQVVLVREKKVVIKKKVKKIADEEETIDDLFNEPAPASPFGKIIWLFKNKIMKFVHGFNEEYEWRVIVGIITAIFITATIGLTILPVLDASRKLLLLENVKRGTQFVNEVKRLNTTSLARGDLNSIQTAFLEDQDANIHAYELLDLNQRIISPANNRNRFTQNPFSVEAIEFFKTEGNKERTYRKFVESDKIGVARALNATNPAKGYEETVGVIAIIFAPSSLTSEAKNNSKAFLEAWTTSILLAIIFFGIIYYLTLRPFQELKFEIEEALRGTKKGVEGKFLFQELNPLKQSINSMLQRLRELQNDDEYDDFGDMEDDSKYVLQLEEFQRGSDGAVMVLNSSQEIHSMNEQCEDLVGIRETSSKGSLLDDVMREQGLAATISSLCDQSANNDGTSQSDTYEIGGSEYNVFVTSLIGKDTFAKAFYISFVKDS